MYDLILKYQPNKRRIPVTRYSGSKEIKILRFFKVYAHEIIKNDCFYSSSSYREWKKNSKKIACFTLTNQCFPMRLRAGNPQAWSWHRLLQALADAQADVCPQPLGFPRVFFIVWSKSTFSVRSQPIQTESQLNPYKVNFHRKGVNHSRKTSQLML